MELTCNQKIVLLLFIVAIVSVVFMEYTREYVDNVTDTTQPQNTVGKKVDALISAAQNFISK